MMRSLFSGVSGLKSHQTRMDTIGNNIANVNTTGFKSSRTTFADTLSQTLTGASAPTGNLGGTNPKQIGLGTGVASIDLLFTDGSVQSTGKNTDLCLSGNGLFVVKRGEETFYTRDGAFEFDSEGNYVLPGSGLFVQGWTTRDADGNIATNAEPTNIKIQAGSSMAAQQTSKATYTGNLNADTTSGTAITTTMTAYDSQGFKYSVPLLFTKTANNTWQLSVANGGNIDHGGTAAFATTPTLTFDANGKYASGTGTVDLTITTGATASQTVTLDLKALTQYANESTIHAETDGHSSGTLSSVSIDSSGVITGVYTNGVRQAEAQVAVAQFSNASGLTKTGNSLYQESNNSGSANIKKASALGCTITPSALEMSNVDIANEFSDMIITQRGFQSNSKIITVGDEMLETMINMKR